MRERVIADLVSLGDDAFYYVRICLTVFTDDKKARLYILFLENVEYFWRPYGVRAVVERQSDLAGFIAGSLNNVRRRYLLVNLTRDQIAAIDLYRTGAVLRDGFYL